MRTLSTGIFAEGRTDVRFLSPVLERFAAETIQVRGHDPVSVARPVPMPGRPSTENFATVVSKNAVSLDILVVHADGNGDAARALADRIEPWFSSVPDFDRNTPRLIPAIPIRETEAWLLSDVDALRDVLGTTLGRADFELPPRVRDVERITDPKRKLKEIHARVAGARRARKLGQGFLYAALGQQVSFQVLRDVPSFRKFADHFETALRSLGFLPDRDNGYKTRRAET